MTKIVDIGVTVDAVAAEAIRPKRDGSSLQRGIRLVGGYADAKNFVDESLEPSFVIIVRHAVLDVNVFAESREKAATVLAAVFLASMDVEVWIATCAAAGADGNPKWSP